MPYMRTWAAYVSVGTAAINVATCFRHVLCTSWRCDNCGPPSSSAEVQQMYDHWRAEFPGATVKASSFDAFVDELVQELPDLKLPVVTAEIGDTWIYGVQSDPLKTANYRAMARARAQCLSAGDCNSNDAEFQNFSRC